MESNRTTTGSRKDVVVRAEDVRRVFAGGAGVHHLDLAVPTGVIFGIIGPSGSGKTTALRLVLGTQTPDYGRMTVFGKPPSMFTPDDRKRIGYLPQSPALYPELSLRHNLDLAASLYGMPWRPRYGATKAGKAARQRVADVLDLVGLSARQRTKLRDASGGEQRRLGLAAALVHRPELLVLDEPSAGIDPLLRRRIWEHLAALRDGGVTLIVTTQYVEEAGDCDLVLILVDGATLVVDTPPGLRRRAFGDDPAAATATFDDVFVRLVSRLGGAGPWATSRPVPSPGNRRG